MGGGASSSVTVSITTKNVAEVLSRSIMKCSAGGTTVQTFKVIGSGNVVKARQVQLFKLSNTCNNSAENITKLQQDVANKIEETAKTQNVALLGVLGSSDSEVNTNIVNEIQAKITNEAISDILTTVSSTQETLIIGDNNIVNITQEQTTEILTEACQNVISRLDSVQKIDNKVKADAEAVVNNPISQILDSIFSGLAGLSFIWLLVIIVVAIAVVLVGPKLLGAFLGVDDGGVTEKNTITITN